MKGRYVGKNLGFVLMGEPVAWARAGRRAGGGSYTPRKQKAHMEAVKWSALQKLGADRKRLWEVPVEVEVIAYFKPSKSWPAWKKAAAIEGSYPHTKKPDADNLVKLVKDALSGVVYRDDSFVVDQIGRKRFAHEERTEVVVRPLFLLGSDHV
jgi:Holliday junction resolvase RusA-like endonuclease